MTLLVYYLRPRFLLAISVTGRAGAQNGVERMTESKTDTIDLGEVWGIRLKLWAEGDKLTAEGKKLWAEAILQAHGNIYNGLGMESG